MKFMAIVFGCLQLFSRILIHSGHIKEVKNFEIENF